MSGEKMILVLFLALAVSSQTCAVTKCGTNTGGLCYSYDAATNTGTSSNCGTGYYCNFDYSSLTKSFSCLQNAAETTVLPGQKCSTTKVCFAGTTCTNGYCVGIATGIACTDTRACAPGLFCKGISAGTPGTCQPLVAAGQACAVTDLCTYGYDCYQGFCKELYSIAAGQSVDATTCKVYPNQVATAQVGVSEYCQYYNCLEDTTANPVTATCIKPLVNMESNSKTCTTCMGMSGTTSYTYNCLCGLSGNKYCPGFPGDSDSATALKVNKEFLTSSEIKKCNIYTGIACIKDHGESEDYYEYQYYHYLAADGYWIHGADDCIVGALTEYLVYKEEYEGSSSSSSSSSYGQFFTVGAFIYAIVA